MNRDRHTKKEKNDDKKIKSILLCTAIVNMINALVNLLKSLM